MYDALLKSIDEAQYQSEMLVLESVDNYVDKMTMMITEATNIHSTDKSLVKKVIEGIKKAFRTIGSFISKIINKIKALFAKNEDKDINDIARRVIGDDSSPITESFYFEGVQKGVDYLTAHGRDPESFSDEIYLQIIGNDIIRIHYRQYRQLNRPDIEKSKDLKNINVFKYKRDEYTHNITSDIVRMLSNLDLLKDLYEKMRKFINELNNAKNNSDHEKLDECHNEFRESFKRLEAAKSKIKIDSKIDLRISEFMEMQSIISKMTIESEKLLYENYDEEFYKKYLGVFGNISHTFIKFQMLLNSFSNKLDFDINFIAPQYRDKIKDPAKLAKFVKGCLDKGITPKYLSYNTWLIANKTMKGDRKHFDPVKGQSRFILFPENDKIVYKIAMSGFGASANNNEYKITNLVKNNPEVRDYFALILNNYEDGALAVQERVVNNLKDNGLDHETYSNSMNALYDKSQSTQDIEDDIGIIQRELGIKTPISLDDLHSANKSIDTNRGHLVLLDYGMLHPNSDLSGANTMSTEEYELLKERRNKNRDFRSGRISKDEYENWKSAADKKAWELRGPQARNTFDLVNKRNELIEKIKNESDSEKIHKLKKEANRYQEEIHKRITSADSHVYGFTPTESK